jgi:hypothetical protein
MTALEDRLRETLQHRATVPRLVDDVAGAAIRAARTRQRRRLVVAAGVIGLAAAITGASLAGGPSAAPVPVTPPTVDGTPDPAIKQAQRHGLSLDVLDGQNLYTLEGAQYTLPPGNPVYIARVAAGWLYGSWDKPASLLRGGGSTLVLTDLQLHQGGGERPNGPAISANGAKVAWVTGNTLYAADLTASGLVNLVSSPVPADSFAVTWAGHVVMVGHEYIPSCCGLQAAEYDVWDPAKGNFVPHWTRGIYPIASPVFEGTPVYVRVPASQSAPSDGGCLVRVDGVASMAPTNDRGCPEGLSFATTEVILSPDGRYLVDYDRIRSMLVVYSLPEISQIHAAAGTCPAGDAPLVWENRTTYLVQDQNTRHVFRCQVGHDTASSLVNDDPMTGWRPVPRYGV